MIFQRTLFRGVLSSNIQNLLNEYIATRYTILNNRIAFRLISDAIAPINPALHRSETVPF